MEPSRLVSSNKDNFQEKDLAKFKGINLKLETLKMVILLEKMMKLPMKKALRKRYPKKCKKEWIYLKKH
jgi:hypothetical protein